MSDNVKGFLLMLVIVLVVGGGIFAIAKNTDSNKTTNTQTADPNTTPVTSGDSLNPENKDAAYIDRLVKFMASKGMTMYGASWCAHCQAQKRALGDAVKDLKYIECSSSTTQKSQAPECDAISFTSASDGKKYTSIQGYPTWIYQGVGYSGEMSIPRMAEIVGFTDSATSQ